MPEKRIGKRGKREKDRRERKRIEKRVKREKRGKRNTTEKKVDIRTQMMWQIKLRIMYV